MNIKKPSKNQGIALILLYVVIIVTGAIIIHNSREKAAAEKEIYQDVSVATGTIEQAITATGKVEAVEKKELIFNKSKTFKGMCAEVNEYVPAGEPLAIYSDGSALTSDQGGVISKLDAPRTGKKGDGKQSITFLNTDQINLKIDIPEDDVNRISIGQEAQVTLSSISNQVYPGSVTYIGGASVTATKDLNTESSSNEKTAAAAENSEAGTEETATEEAAEGSSENGSSGEKETINPGDAKYTVVITLDNDGTLRPGMSAECTILLDRHENILTVPIAAVKTENGSRYVTVVKDNGKTEKVTVETGVSDAENVEIVTGLSGTEKIRMKINQEDTGSKK